MIKKNFYSFYIILFLICIIQIGVGIFWGMQKVNYMEDEIFTYSLSNNLTGKDIIVTQGKSIDRDFLYDYVTVQSDHRFDYSNVWQNQAIDVHPPFYYMLIHTLCSLFPQKFIPFIGIALNLFFSTIITILIYTIMKELTKNDVVSLLSCIAWSFSLTNMTFVVFIRMYLMLTAIMLATTLLHIKYFKKSLTKTFYFTTFLLAILGTLTHYYFLIYLFFQCIIFGIYLLSDKQFKGLLTYFVSLIGAGIASYFIFPSILDHIFNGYRGEESFENIKVYSDIFTRYLDYFTMINKELFYNLFSILLVITLLFVVIFLVKRKEKIEWNQLFFSSYNLILFPCIFYFILVGKISVYIEERYMMPIFPMVLILIIFAITYFSSKIFVRKNINIVVTSFFAIISIVGLCTNGNNINYLYKESAPIIDFAKNHKESDVLIIYTDEWMLNGFFLELLQYEHLTMINVDHLSQFSDLISSYNDAIVYINASNHQDVAEILIHKNPYWSSYTLEGSSNYSVVYSFSK